MPLLDIILLALLFGFAVAGFWVGFIRALGYLTAIVVGLLIAFNFYSPLALWLQQLLGGNLTLYKVIFFIALFGSANRLVVFLFWIVEKIIIVPFLGIINRLIGAFLALMGGVLVLGLLLYVMTIFPLAAGLSAYLTNSSLASFLIQASKILWPLLPQTLKRIPVLF